ncbi:MAG: Gfo/Idh/MocA family oxidoreductase [Deltaproteobacteria bacterium]|jgi:predicted dehydrogenase
MSERKYRVAVVGCGLIGGKRSDVIVNDPRCELAVVVDPNEAAAKRLGERVGAPWSTSWSGALADSNADIVVVATPNAFLAEICISALKKGKHVLVEKPMGRNIHEAIQMAGAATSTNQVLKIGFNHRYHPALMRAHEMYADGEIGQIINIRARYGHGGRPGYENEWRGNRELAGGGELTDQGVHVIDLIAWFAGEPTEVFGYLQTAAWPIAPLEDSAFALMKFESGALASFHTAWTQWKNMFSFEVFGTDGSVTVDGLGRSYGPETLIFAKRKKEGGAPYMSRTVYDEEDISWKLEWDDLIRGIETGRYMGTPNDGVVVMRVLDAIYRAAEQRQPIGLD